MKKFKNFIPKMFTKILFKKIFTIKRKIKIFYENYHKFGFPE